MRCGLWWLACAASVALGGEPADTPLAVAELGDLSPVVARIRKSGVLERLGKHPDFANFRDSDQGQQASAGVAMVAALAQTDPDGLVDLLANNRWSAALYPPAGTATEPVLVVGFAAGDKPRWSKLWKALESFAPAAGDKVRRRKLAKGTAFAIDKKLFLFVNDDGFTATSNKDVLEGIVGKEGDKPPAPTAGLRSAFGGKLWGERPAGLFRLTADGAALRKLLAKGKTPDGKTDNALGTLLVGDLILAALHAEGLGLDVGLTEQGFAAAAAMLAKPEELAADLAGFAIPPEGKGLADLPRVPGYLGGISWHRDLAALYARREQLLVDRVQPDFDKFESGIGVFLGGRNFAADVLPTFGRRFAFLAAEQDYKELGGTPAMKIPGFAAVLELAKPEEAGKTLKLISQTIRALTVVQVMESKQGEPQLASLETYRGIAIEGSDFLTKPKGDSLPLSYNFSPTMAIVGDRAILATSRGLCKALVDFHLDKRESAATRRSYLVDIDPVGVSRWLGSIKGQAVADGIRKGKTPEAAEGELETVRELLSMVPGLSFSTVHQADRVVFTMEARIK